MKRIHGCDVHSCNPSIGRLRQENCEFKDSLGYRERPSLKKTLNK
jgi:hypothetical protein